MNDCGNSDRLQVYVYKMLHPMIEMIEKYVDGREREHVKIIVTGSTRMSWRYDDKRCVCGGVK